MLPAVHGEPSKCPEGIHPTRGFYYEIDLEKGTATPKMYSKEGLASSNDDSDDEDGAGNVSDISDLEDIGAEKFHLCRKKYDELMLYISPPAKVGAKFEVDDVKKLSSANQFLGYCAYVVEIEAGKKEKKHISDEREVTVQQLILHMKKTVKDGDKRPDGGIPTTSTSFDLTTSAVFIDGLRLIDASKLERFGERGIISIPEGWMMDCENLIAAEELRYKIDHDAMKATPIRLSEDELNKKEIKPRADLLKFNTEVDGKIRCCRRKYSADTGFALYIGIRNGSAALTVASVMRLGRNGSLYNRFTVTHIDEGELTLTEDGMKKQQHLTLHMKARPLHCLLCQLGSSSPVGANKDAIEEFIGTGTAIAYFINDMRVVSLKDVQFARDGELAEKQQAFVTYFEKAYRESTWHVEIPEAWKAG